MGSPFTSERERVLDPALALHNTPLSSALPHLTEERESATATVMLKKT